MKNIFKITASILILIMLLTSILPVNASVTKAKLLNIYSDGMLFKQSSEGVICGSAEPDSKIKLDLYDQSGALAEISETITGKDGKFSISFDTPAGSFNEYKICLFEDGKLFDTLDNIVFGELWLASGQSNMQYPLGQSKTGLQMYNEQRKLSHWLRVLLVPAYPEYKNSTSLVPLNPQEDISDAVWVSGEDSSIYGMSAVAYFFAEQLMNEINMPVGILNSSLGGSTIVSWLSRETIDNNQEIKDYLFEREEYITKESWKEDSQSVYYDMTANFNQKIAPLKNFRLSGMLWYQGETDLMFGNTKYSEHIDLLQKSYSDLFNYKNGLLPFIFTQLAAYNYSDDGVLLSDWNSLYTEIQEAEPDSRALVTIYDIPLTFFPEVGLIHPERKKEVGQRMAFAATRMLYTKQNSFTSPTIDTVTINGNEVLVKFKNTGDGLKSNGTEIKGFSICDKNGIFVNATAEITDCNTVKVSSSEISAPVSVSYAYCTANQSANLYASSDGKLTLPVAPFVSDRGFTDNLWKINPWTFCDEELIWHTEDDKFSGYYNSWEANNSEISYSDNLTLTSSEKCFSVSPVISYKDGLLSKPFIDTENDFSKYGKLSFRIKNTGNENIIFEGARLYINSALWYSPEIDNTLDIATTIPNDGEWHTVTLNLNKLYHLGNECSLSYDNSKIREITKIDFNFSGKQAAESKISIDSFTFTPDYENCGTSYDVNIKNADNPIEFFTAIILTLIGAFAKLFNI